MFKLAKASIYSMLLALLLASCSMGSNAPRGTAVISVVGNTSASSRSAMSRSTGTLIPEEVPSIVSFDVSLSAVELKDGKWVQSEDKSGNIKNESFSADYSSETQDLTITGVKAGTYRVSLVGLDSSGNAIMNGSSDENLVVTPDQSNRITINMALITSGKYTGSALMTFDWADLAESNETIKEAMADGGLVFTLYYRLNSGDDWKIGGETNPSGTTATRIEFLAENLPASPGLDIKYVLSTKSGLVLNPVLTVTVAQIYSGLTSTPTGTEDGIYYIKAEEVSEAVNVYDVKWEALSESSAKISWKNQMADGDVLFDYVNMTCTGSDGSKIEKPNNKVTGAESSITLDGLNPKIEYTLSFQAHHKTGMLSPIYTLPDKFVSKILVTGIEINESDIPENLAVGDSFVLTATISPDTATIKSVKWESSNTEVLKIDGDKFTALKAGTAVITATSVDNTEAKDTVSVNINLAAPKNVRATANGASVTITWEAVQGASSYTILRSADGAQYVELTSGINGTSYTDTEIFSGSSYSYKVKATASNLTGIESEATSNTEISGNAIHIVLPSNPDRGFEIKFENDEKLVLESSKESITVTAIPNDSILTYQWMMNGTIIQNEKTAAEGGNSVVIQGNTPGIKHGMTNSLNTLTLKVKTKSELYVSASKDFGYVDVIDTGVSISSHAAGQTYRVSSKTSENENRTIQINASVTPSDATLKSIRFTSSDTSIATVGTYTGLVEFVGGTGEVTITASSFYGEPVSVTFDVYEVTVNSAKDLVNIVNEAISVPFQAANSENEFNNNWWEKEYKTYEKIANVSIRRSRGTGFFDSEQEGAQAKFDSFIPEKINNITISGVISLLAKDEGGAGYLGSDPLEIIGNGNESDTLTITLPGNQGTATIKYNSINTLNNNSGNYTVTFSEKILGYSGTDLSDTVQHTDSDVVHILN